MTYINEEKFFDHGQDNICSVFGCGRKLSLQESLFGTRCIRHDKVNFKEPEYEYFNEPDVNTWSQPETGSGLTIPDAQNCSACSQGVRHSSNRYNDLAQQGQEDSRAEAACYETHSGPGF